MKQLTDEEKWKLLSEKSPDKQQAESIGVGYMAETIRQLPSDSAADLLRTLPADFASMVLNTLPEPLASDLRELLSYGADCAGAIMAKEYLAIPSHLRVKEAIDLLHRLPKEKKGDVPYIYILNDKQRLSGVIAIEDLIFNAPEKRVSEIAVSPVDSILADAPQKNAAKLIQEKNYFALPVVKNDGEIAGVISANSVMQFMQEQANQDIAKMIGTDAEEMTSHSPMRILRLRLPWLLFSVASGLFCAYISELFQHHMAEIAVLFIFVPVILGISESTGIQGATIVVRNLTMQAMPFKELVRLMGREILVGIMIGVICGILVGIITSFWQGSRALGIAICVSMNVAVLVSAVIGLLLPVIFKALKLDPAVASGPLVLALCDIQTLGVYFFLAGTILRALQ